MIKFNYDQKKKKNQIYFQANKKGEGKKKDSI